MALVSIVVPTIGRLDCLERLCESIGRNTRGVAYEIVIVLPKSFSLPTKFLNKYKPRLVWEEIPEGVVKAQNKGFRAATGKHLIHINDDAEFCPDAINNMISVVGDQDAIGAFYYKTPTSDYHTSMAYGREYANFGFFKMAIAQKLHFWDEQYYFYGADPDFCFRAIQAGYPVIGVPTARVIHHESQEHRSTSTIRSDSDKLGARWG